MTQCTTINKRSHAIVHNTKIWHFYLQAFSQCTSVSTTAHKDAAQQQDLECRHQLEQLHQLTRTLAGDLTDTVQRCQQMHTEGAVLMTRLSAAQHGLDNIKSLMLQQLHMSRRTSIDYGSVGTGAVPALAITPPADVPPLKPSASTAQLPSMLALPGLPSPKGAGTPCAADIAAASSAAAAAAADEPTCSAATPAGTRGLHRTASERLQDPQAASASTSTSHHSPGKPGSSRAAAPGTSTAADCVLELNVRGTILCTLRSTLTQVPGSYLADLFSAAGCQTAAAAAAAAGPEPAQLVRDAQGRPFLPYDPACFAAVVDGLHELQLLGSAQPLALSAAAQHKQPQLQALVQVLGLQQALPVAGVGRGSGAGAGAGAALGNGTLAGPWPALLQQHQQMGGAMGLGAVQASGMPAGPAPAGVRVPNLYSLMAAKGE